MSFEFDFSTLPEDPSTIHDSSNRATPGKGMALIKDWQEYTGKSGNSHTLTLEILAWSTPRDVGKQHTQLIWLTDKSNKQFHMRILSCLAMAAGLFTPADVAEWKRKQERPYIDMSKLIGRPVMIELVEEPDINDSSKKYLRIGNIGLGYWHCMDPKTKDWPKDIRTLNAAAALIGQWDAPATAKPAARPAPAPTTKPAGADPFSGF